MDNETREMFNLILNKLESIDVRLDSMESRLDSMESRQNEIFQVVKAIEHANNVHRAEIDNIKVRTDYLEGTFNAIGDIISSRKVAG